MSLVVMESGDFPNIKGYAGKKWGVLGTFVNDGDVHFGRKCLQGSSGGQIPHSFPDKEHATIIAGARYVHGWTNANSTQGFITLFSDGGTRQHIALTANANGSIDVHLTGVGNIHTTDPGVFPNNSAWFSIQIKATIDDAAGSVEVQIDKQTIINLSGIDTRNAGADALIDWVSFSGDQTWHVRDMFIATGDGSGISDLFVRPWMIEGRLVDGTGDLSDFTPNTGTNEGAVDEGDPDDDTTYNASTVAGDRDSFTFQDLVSITEDPVAVQAHCIARYLDSPMSLGTFLRRSATNDDGDLQDVASGWASHGVTVWETDPIAAGAWTIANFNATQFGYRSGA